MQQLSGIFAARWIVPITRPPLYRGWVHLKGGRVLQLSTGRQPAIAVDLGDVALLPGLVNAHTHLEFSDRTEPIGQPGTPLASWIGQVVAHRASAGGSSVAARRAALQQGLAESAAAGVHLLGEIATEPWPLESLAAEHPQIVAFGEVLGLSAERQQQTLAAALSRLHRLPAGVAWGLSPHAPYSAPFALVGRVLQHANKHQLPVAMHWAETADEAPLLTRGEGPLATALRQIGAWRDGVFPSPGGVEGLLLSLLTTRRLLLVHGNYLTDTHIQWIARHPGATVVYCPRTHAYFGHRPHPVAELLRAGVRVALGTDSRASNPDLSLWREARWLLEHRSDLDPHHVLRMATAAGAEALGRRDCGRLAPGASPGLIRFSTQAATVDQLFGDLATTDPQPVEHGLLNP